ncbi:RHS repeat-associated core domain-containing protein [Pseudomonas baetica]|uniref:RHS repeat-associated core domain-containing protein n=1 Tax=Pseudomonas baetica TaxID=674054 RepID=UPI003EEBE5F8
MSAGKQNPKWQRAVLLAIDNSQSVIGEIADGKTHLIGYSAYGDQSSKQEISTNLGFTGQLRESDIGWYLLGNGYRAYNPRMMRFHIPDSLSPFDKGGMNAYAYCNADPMNQSDPTGRSPWAFSRFVQALTDAVQTVATPVLRKTASLANSGVSQVLGAAKSAKKAFADNFLFDPKVLEKLGPPPPKFNQKPPSNRVVTRPNPYSGPDTVRGQQTPFVSSTGSGLRITGTTGPTTRATALRKGN